MELIPHETPWRVSGRACDSLRGKTKRLLRAVETEHQRLGRLGADVLNGPHFKQGTRKMFFTRPSRQGKRAHVYAGVDPGRQVALLARQRRARAMLAMAKDYRQVSRRLAAAEEQMSLARAALQAAYDAARQGLADWPRPREDYYRAPEDVDAPCPQCGQPRRRLTLAHGGALLTCTHCPHVENA